MEVEHMRFHGEQDVNFPLFCDVPCPVRYLERIPLSASPVEIYAIEPGHQTQWIAVQRSQEECGSATLSSCVRAQPEIDDFPPSIPTPHLTLNRSRPQSFQ